MIRLTAVITCHNRRESTLTCLRALASSCPIGVSLAAVVADDGSRDGTADAVSAEFDWVTVLKLEGTSFWARGMAEAEHVALQSDPDFLLWLNDDVVLDKDAVQELLATLESCGQVIVVGALRDPQTAAVTYSGYRTGWHPLRLSLVSPSGRPAQVDTFNGNVVLLPRSVIHIVGNIDGEFEHALADLDYGLRTRAAGQRAFVASKTVGLCRRNSLIGSWRDSNLNVQTRWRLLLGPKGLPPRSQARFLRRHGGHIWPLLWVIPYLKFLGGISRSLRRSDRHTNVDAA